jgi:3-oxoacyl-[acyl-carrier protein] reductase
MHEFDGQAILVTGSTRGIGRAIAERLLKNGSTVGIHGRSAERVDEVCREFSAFGGRTVPLACDFSEPRSAGPMVQAFHAAAGKIDGLVNNAGSGRAVAFRGLTIESWRATFAVNVEAAMVASREAYTLMRRQTAGNVVNIASIAAHGPGKWMGADYAAAKASIASMTKSMAFEAARFGIRVNAVSPGFIETAMTAILPSEQREKLGIPLGRLGQPEEIASVVAFLLSSRSCYLTGEVLHVDGGLWM